MRASRSGIYVEIAIRGSTEELWKKTQDPRLHQRWDLRFTEIDYLPRAEDNQPQEFLYETRIGFGLRICGRGESVGSHDDRQGNRTSSLKFWSDDPKSLIHKGSGYWKYIRQPDSIRFLTWYDYQPRFGIAGRLFDQAIFRPLMGWATAWSFDRLRLWIEQGIDPDTTLRNSLIHALARMTLAFIWLYHGLVPKLMFPATDEITMLTSAGVPGIVVPMFLIVLGLAEIGLGILMLTSNRRGLFLLMIVIMILALIGIIATSPEYLTAAFNPVTLNLSVVVLALIGLISSRNLASARHCLREDRHAVNL
jgi:hypothetical protein